MSKNIKILMNPIFSEVSLILGVSYRNQNLRKNELNTNPLSARPGELSSEIFPSVPPSVPGSLRDNGRQRGWDREPARPISKAS